MKEKWKNLLFSLIGSAVVSLIIAVILKVFFGGVVQMPRLGEPYPFYLSDSSILFVSFVCFLVLIPIFYCIISYLKKRKK